jgi:uncharacterized ferritin-like protein (DUF455 family)
MSFPDGSLERWANDYVLSTSLAHKLAPPSPPTLVLDHCAAVRLARPGRPVELRLATEKTKTPRSGALRDPKKRAELLHTFLHHELQAAELMCWAVLAFPETPRAFKRGLIGICSDEIRHMQVYAAHIETLGCKVGDFPVRDWFWSRVPHASSPSAFLAVMGLGFEAGNLDHTQRFAERFRAVGDDAGAKLQELVAHEEISHVAFAAHWFRVFEGELSFERWCDALPSRSTRRGRVRSIFHGRVGTMATRIAWLLNLDADLELQDPVAYQPRKLNEARTRELLARMADLVSPDDAWLDVSTGHASLSTPADATVQAFCPTPSALRRISALGLRLPAAPSFDVLRAVNDRAFCAAIGHGLPHSLFARDMLSLQAHLTQPSPSGSHVIKRAFSFAGREQRRVHNGVIDDSTRGFCERSFARGEGVQVEPWVERILDLSRHGYITRNSDVLVDATREQHIDSMGRYLGMSSGPARVTTSDDARLEAEVRRTGEALLRAGYFGPFGIDGFSYRWPDGTHALNARCEINARYTMGYPRGLMLKGVAVDER